MTVNLSHLSDDELINHLLMFNTDPVIARLVDMVITTERDIFRDLVCAGMDPEELTFDNTYTPGEYINHLKNELDYYSDENDELAGKVRKLEARTVAELIAELGEQTQQSERRAQTANKEMSRALEAERTALEKLKIWNALTAE